MMSLSNKLYPENKHKSLLWNAESIRQHRVLTDIIRCHPNMTETGSKLCASLPAGLPTKCAVFSIALKNNGYKEQDGEKKTARKIRSNESRDNQRNTFPLKKFSRNASPQRVKVASVRDWTRVGDDAVFEQGVIRASRVRCDVLNAQSIPMTRRGHSEFAFRVTPNCSFEQCVKTLPFARLHCLWLLAQHSDSDKNKRNLHFVSVLFSFS